MRTDRRPITASFLSCCLCSCVAAGVAGDPVSATPTASPASPTAGPALTATFTPEPPPEPVERPLYVIRAALDTRASEANGWTMPLTVQEQVTYTNRSGESINELVLQFEPARRADLFELIGVSSSLSSATFPASVADGQLRIPLDAPLESGESVRLRLEYRRLLAPENTLIGWNDYQIVLGNWYAFFPPYVAGRGWLAHPPGNVGEHLSFAYADFDVQFEWTGDASYWIAASGIEEKGSSPPRFRFTGRSFAMALTTQSPHARMAGNVEVIGYTRPEYEAQGEFITDIAAKAVTVFAERYGEYPHPRLTLLESELPDGMEFDGLVFLNPDLFPYYEGNGADYLTAITAHETAHQWWYGRVANDQAIDPWLDEPFATYSELLFYERHYPSLVDWWWWTRVDRYASKMCVDMPIYQFKGFRDYVDTVYLRGAQMLHALRMRMGNQAFLESLQDLQHSYFGSVIVPADAFRVFQSHTAHPLYGIWDEYLCLPPPHE
ncbi:MAG: hypothetical protein JW929_02230 [Anaerolineales bacterium]|nr:hypothetical protein [Anaerolineales bacterium]